jgi:hypothetical protein
MLTEPPLLSVFFKQANNCLCFQHHFFMLQSITFFQNISPKRMWGCIQNDAMTFSITTLSIMGLFVTLSIMTLSIMTLSIMTLSIMTQHNDAQHNGIICDTLHKLHSV